MRRSFDIELFAFFDIENPMVAWEVAIGRVSSGVSDTPAFGISLWMHSLLRHFTSAGLSWRVLNEFKLERVRQEHAPDRVSRLDGVFFFRTEGEARDAADRWGWFERETLLSRVLFSPSRLTEVDSEWITQHLQSGDDDWMQYYWDGATRGRRPVTEILARGVGMIDNPSLRQQAYERIVAEHPFSSKVLSFGAAAFWSGINNAAQVRPGILKSDGGIRVDHHIYMADFQVQSGLDMAAVLKQCAEDGAVFPYDPRCDELDVFTVPDFREASFRIEDRRLEQLSKEILANTR